MIIKWLNNFLHKISQKNLRETDAAIKHSSIAPHDCLPVLTSKQLLQQLNTKATLDRIFELSGFSPVNFKHDCLSLIEKFAELVQLMPASESHHHAQPGGLLCHTLEAVEIALRLRQGLQLPQGAPPDVQLKMHHRWTYAIIVSVILHDIGKTFSDLVIQYFSDKSGADGILWHPLAGSLVTCGANYYRVNFVDPAYRDYDAHTKLSMVLLQDLVPQATRQWLAADHEVINALQAHLQQTAKPDALIKKIVQQSDQTSVKRNLRFGPRTRFSTARAVPLIERMMQALQRMLTEGSLPLNKSGAAGWIYQECIWLVSKRIADEVRQYLIKNESAQGIPGADKNDRLFDTWQEYGALIENPATGGAVWRVQVEGDDYQHELTVLCFPLHKIFDAIVQPSSMCGRITPLEQPLKSPLQVIVSKTVEPKESITTSATIDYSQQDGTHITNNKIDETSSPDSNQSGTDEAPVSQMPVTTETAANEVAQINHQQSAALAASTHDDIVKPPETWSAHRSLMQLKSDKLQKKQKRAAQSGQISETALSNQSEKTGKHLHENTDEHRELMPIRLPIPAVLTESRQNKIEKKSENFELAQQFMIWLQNNLANGIISYNDSSSMIHFAEEGMLLVTPRIYREFAAQHVELDKDKGYTEVQKAIKDAGWLIKPKTQSFWWYEISKGEGLGCSRICVSLIKNPEQFVNPLPPPNPRLKRQD